MDGWRRPNHMLGLMDALQTTTCDNLRRFPGRFHSVATQGSSKIEFFCALGRFCDDFGKGWEAETGMPLDFRVMFFDVF